MTDRKRNIGAIDIICNEDCGNAPKKEFLKNLNIAFARSDVAFILENLTADAEWNIIGDRIIRGKGQVAEAFHQKVKNLTEMTISSIITHGYDGAANGTLTFGNCKKSAFCTVYKFNSSRNKALVKEMTSYIVELAR